MPAGMRVGPWRRMEHRDAGNEPAAAVREGTWISGNSRSAVACTEGQSGSALWAGRGMVPT